MLTERDKKEIGETLELARTLASNMTVKEVNVFHALVLEKFRNSMNNEPCKSKIDPLAGTPDGLAE